MKRGAYIIAAVTLLGLSTWFFTAKIGRQAEVAPSAPGKSQNARSSPRGDHVPVTKRIISLDQVSSPDDGVAPTSDEIRARVASYLDHRDFKNWDIDDLMSFQRELGEVYGGNDGAMVYRLLFEEMFATKPGLMLAGFDALIAGKSVTGEGLAISEALWSSKEQVLSSMPDMEALWTNTPKVASCLLLGASESARSEADVIDAWLILRASPNPKSHLNSIHQAIEKVADADHAALATRGEPPPSLLGIEDFALKNGSADLLQACRQVGLERAPIAYLQKMEESSKNGAPAFDGDLSSAFVKGALKNDPHGGLAAVANMRNTKDQEVLTRGLVREWLRRDPMAASESVGATLKGRELAVAANEISAYLMSVGDRAGALQWKNTARSNGEK